MRPRQLWSVTRLGAIALSVLLEAACASEPPAVAEAPQAIAPRKDSDAVSLLLLVEAGGSNEDERAAAERALRQRLASSPRFTLDPVPGADSEPQLKLWLSVGGVEGVGGAIRQKLVLTGALHGGACQIFQFAPVLTKPGGKPEDDSARRELLDIGVGDLVGKLESSSSKLENASCLATGPAR